VRIEALLNMAQRWLSILAATLCVAMASAAASAVSPPVPLATFADPGTTSFTYKASLKQLTASNPHVQLDMLNGQYKGNTYDARFTLTDNSGGWLDLDTTILNNPRFNNSGVLLAAMFEGGKLEFFNNDPNHLNELILRALFDSIKLSPMAVGAKFSVSNEVRFEGPGGFKYGDTQASFSFALTNLSNPNAFLNPLKSFTATSSFSSSSVPLIPEGVVPEPGTIILTGVALFGLAAVVRRKFKGG